MTTIPEVRDRLTAIADAMRKSSDPNMLFLSFDVDEAVEQLWRRRAPRIAPVKMGPPTDHQKNEVRRLAAIIPKLSQLEIGNRVGLNQGRVSEILRGKRR